MSIAALKTWIQALSEVEPTIGEPSRAKRRNRGGIETAML